MGVGGNRPFRSRLTSAGITQVSFDNKQTWVTSFPAGELVAGQPVDFHVRTEGAIAADDGTYHYSFFMSGATGGLSNISTARNEAHVTGVTPADQVGLQFTMDCTITDTAGTGLTSTPVTGTWAVTREITETENAKK